MAIYFRAALGIVRRVVLSVFEPVMDFVLTFLGIFILTPYWELFKSGNKNYYPEEFYYYIIPGYILTWMFFVYFAGGYEKRIKPMSLIRGIAMGTLAIIVVYALLPETMRYSRAIILLGSVWAVISVTISRLMGSILFKDNRTLVWGNTIKRIATIGSASESKRVVSMLHDLGLKYEFVGRVSESGEDDNENVIGTVDQLDEITKVNKIDELIFCSKDVQASSIITTMLAAASPTTEFKIAPPESLSVIGSNSIHTAGDLYVIDINTLSKGVNKRKKRLFDIVAGTCILLFSPLLMWIMKSPTGLLRNAVLVVFGTLSWVGIEIDDDQSGQHKELKEGVLTPADGLQKKEISNSLKQRINIMYARDYKVINDLSILLRSFRDLGRGH